MNGYYEVMRVLKGYLEADNDINTVTKGDIADIDLDKKNIFGLAHVNISGAAFKDGVIVFNIAVFAMDIRNHSNEIPKDKFIGNDNEDDNLNTMLYVLNRLFLSIKKKGGDFQILGEPSLEPFTESRKNLLDGWAMRFELEIPNTTLSVC